jgi:hypothetical protein
VLVFLGLGDFPKSFEGRAASLLLMMNSESWEGLYGRGFRGERSQKEPFGDFTVNFLPSTDQATQGVPPNLDLAQNVKSVSIIVIA